MAVTEKKREVTGWSQEQGTEQPEKWLSEPKTEDYNEAS